MHLLRWLIRLLGGEVDLRSLGLFRIGLGLVLLIDLVFSKLWYFDQFFSIEAPLLPVKSMLETPSLIAHLDSDLLVKLVLSVQVLATVCFTLGLQTFAANLICYIATAQLNTHNPFVLHNGDITQVVLLFWSLFLPLGAAFSLDEWLAGQPEGRPATRQYLGVGAVGLRVQVASLYIFSTWFKTGLTWTRDYTATEFAMQIPYYQTPLSRFVLASVPIELLRTLTQLVLQWERWAPVLLWFLPCTVALLQLVRTSQQQERRLLAFASVVQLLTLLSGICLHVGFGSCLRLGQFWAIGVVLWFSFKPTWCWHSPLDRNARPPKRQTMTASSGVNTVALLFTILIIVANVASVDDRARDTPVDSAIQFFSLMQKWNMFSPNPPQVNWNHVVVGRRNDGTVVRLFEASAEHGKNSSGCRGYESHAWFKLWESTLRSPHAPRLRHSIARSFCPAAVEQGLEAVLLSVFYTHVFPDPQNNPASPDDRPRFLTPWISC